MSPSRAEKLWHVIKKRQKDLAVILENVHDAHNLGAILRSCDAVGVRDLYIIFSDDIQYCKIGRENPLGRKAAGRTLKWIDVHYFTDTASCVAAVRKKYKHIYTTHIADNTRSLYDLPLADSVAVLFGNERDGVSETAVALSDGNFLIPQVGMAQSLNVSVACAVTLYEALRQRTLAGKYDTPTLSTKEQAALYELWKEK